MQTVLTDDLTFAAEIILAGGLVAFPTETVYGLGADVFNAEAIAKIFRAKQRPADNPLIAHVGYVTQIEKLAATIPQYAEPLIENFFPGPLTLVFKKRPEVPDIATAGLDTIGVRMPRDPVASDLLRACGTPVVAPSANISGRPSPTTWQAVMEDMDGRIDCIVRGEATELGVESTVVDCSGERPSILRSGAVSFEDLKVFAPDIQPIASEGDLAKSPGTRHRHYKPRANVRAVVIDRSAGYGDRAAYIGIGAPRHPANFVVTRSCRSPEDYARTLFEFFRQCDRDAIKTIVCQVVDEAGIGAALMDRINRAADQG